MVNASFPRAGDRGDEPGVKDGGRKPRQGKSMSYPISASPAGPASIDLRENALGILFLFMTVGAFAFRLFVTPDLMNMLMDYTSEGGPFYAKFHLGTYAMGATLAIILASRPLILTGEDVGLFRSLVRYVAVLTGLAVYLVLIGQLSAIGFVIDTYLAAVVAGALLLVQTEQVRRIAATSVLCIMIAGAIIAIGEVTVGHRLMPFTESETAFRATGLSSHPLSLGAHCAVAIGFVPLTRWRIWVKIAAIFVLFIGCVAAGARLALMLSTVEILLLLLFVRWPKLSPRHERQAKLIAFFATIFVGSVLAVLLLSVGLLSRFSSVVDDNSMARVRIYEVFNHVSWNDILFGMNSADLLRIVNEKVGLPFIESAPVIIIMLQGLPAAIFFTIVVARYILRILRGAPIAAKIGAATFILVDLSNNALANKTPDIILLTILIIGLRGAIRSGPVPAKGLQRAALRA